MIEGDDRMVTLEGQKAAILELRERVYELPELQFARDLAARGLRVVLVGGVVRDAMLGEKSKDFDFVVEGISTLELEQLLKEMGGEVSEVSGRAHGVLKYQPIVNGKLLGEEIDIALPRTESYIGGGKKKDVTVEHDGVTIEDDFSRRDFTINAMGLNIATGELVDPFGGSEDLKNGIIKAVGDNPDQTFLDDPSRILRGVRFSSRYKFRIEQRTLDAMKAHSPEVVASIGITDGSGAEKIVPRVSDEPFGKEFRKSMTSGAEGTIKLYDEIGLLDLVLPELKTVASSPEAMSLFKKSPKEVVAGINGQAEGYELQGADSEIINLALAFENVSLREDIFRRLRFDNKLVEGIGAVLGQFGKIDLFESSGSHTRKDMVRKSWFPNLLVFAVIKYQVDKSEALKRFITESLLTYKKVYEERERGYNPRIIDGNKTREIIISHWPGFNRGSDMGKVGPLVGRINDQVNAEYDDDDNDIVVDMESAIARTHELAERLLTPEVLV